MRSAGLVTSRAALSDALRYFEDAFLVGTVKRFSRALADSARSPVKVYAIDPGLAYANSSAPSEDVGQRLEDVVYLELRRRHAQRRTGAIASLKTVKSGFEVDFIVGDALSQKGSALYQVSVDASAPKTYDRETRALREAIGRARGRRGVSADPRRGGAGRAGGRGSHSRDARVEVVFAARPGQMIRPAGRWVWKDRVHGVSAGMPEGAGGIPRRRRCSRACRSAWTRATASASSGATATASPRCSTLLAGMLEPDEGRVLRNGATRAVGVLGQADALSDDDTVGRAIVGDMPEYEWAGDARASATFIAGSGGGHPLGRPRGHAFGRPAPSRGPGTAADRRLGRAGAGRADEPSGRARHHVARGPSEEPLEAGRRARSWWSRTTAGFWTRCARACGRSTTEPWSPSKAASPPTSCSGWSATGWRRWPSRSARTPLRRELAVGSRARGAGPSDQAEVPREGRPGAHRRRAAACATSWSSSAWPWRASASRWWIWNT